MHHDEELTAEHEAEWALDLEGELMYDHDPEPELLDPDAVGKLYPNTLTRAEWDAALAAYL